jgi:hypothetical protein
MVGQAGSEGEERGSYQPDRVDLADHLASRVVPR